MHSSQMNRINKCILITALITAVPFVLFAFYHCLYETSVIELFDERASLAANAFSATMLTLSGIFVFIAIASVVWLIVAVGDC